MNSQKESRHPESEIALAVPILPTLPIQLPNYFVTIAQSGQTGRTLTTL
jgi:hypothetical protein